MSLRPIRGMEFPNIELPQEPVGPPPSFELLDPKNLLVDETYQRGLSRRSLSIVKKVASEWSWSKFKPPIVVHTDQGPHVIDGQHTAIAAVTRGISKIPCVVVDSHTIADRAQSFVSHNRDRVIVTSAQIFKARLAAGDEMCLGLARVAEETQCVLTVEPVFSRPYAVGEFTCVSRALTCYEKSPNSTRDALIICREAGCRPISQSVLLATFEFCRMVNLNKFSLPKHRCHLIAKRVVNELWQNETELKPVGRGNGNQTWRVILSRITEEVLREQSIDD